jgi:hypothetical protein
MKMDDDEWWPEGLFRRLGSQLTYATPKRELLYSPVDMGIIPTRRALRNLIAALFSSPC